MSGIEELLQRLGEEPPVAERLERLKTQPPPTGPLAVVVLDLRIRAAQYFLSQVEKDKEMLEEFISKTRRQQRKLK